MASISRRGESAINSAEFKNPIDTTALNLVNVLAPQASVVYDTSSGVVLLRVARQSPPIDIESFAFTPGILGSESLDRVYVSDASSNGVIGGVERLRLEAGDTSSLADQFDDDRFIESNDSPIPHIDPGMLTTASSMEVLDWAMLNPQPLPQRV